MTRKKRKNRSKRYTGVERLPDGRYRIRARAIDPKTGKLRERDRVVEAETAKEAAEKRSALLKELKRGKSPVKRERAKLKTFARSWLASKLPGLKPSTRKTYAEILDVHVLPVLGEYYVDSIELEDLVEWRDGMSGAVESINGRIRVAKQVIRAAVEHYSLPRDPTLRLEKLRKPYREEDEFEDVQRLTANELRNLLVAVEKHYPQWLPLIAMLALTGLRFGEATAVKWHDLDLETGVLRVRRAQWHNIIDHPKTKLSRRTIVLDPWLLSLLKDHRQKLIKKQRKGLETGFVFLSRVGRLHWQSCLTKPLREAKKIAKIDKEVSAQTFRKTFNHLAEEVAAGRVVRSLVGHEKEDMTAHYSGGATIDEKRAAVTNIVKLVGLKNSG